MIQIQNTLLIPKGIFHLEQPIQEREKKSHGAKLTKITILNWVNSKF